MRLRRQFRVKLHKVLKARLTVLESIQQIVVRALTPVDSCTKPRQDELSRERRKAGDHVRGHGLQSSKGQYAPESGQKEWNAGEAECQKQSYETWAGREVRQRQGRNQGSSLNERLSLEVWGPGIQSSNSGAGSLGPAFGRDIMRCFRFGNHLSRSGRWSH